MNFDNEAQPNYNQQQDKKEQYKSTIPAKKPCNLEHQLVDYAKRLFAEYVAGKKTVGYVKRSLAVRKQSFPQSVDNFKRWTSTYEGRQFMDTIFPRQSKIES